MTETISKALQNLPSLPGVYRFYNSSNELMYIGKAKNLKHRVRSYFQDRYRLIESRGQRIDLMVSQIYRLDYTVVSSEKESLILEANLIHSLQPKYNVSLKDDKSYLYVRVTLGDQVPGIFLSRQKYDPKSLYFGPYTKKVGIAELIRVVRQIFPFCQEKRISGRPCEYVGLHLCEGICEGKEDLHDYKAKIDQIVKILSGQTKLVKNFIQEKMKEAVKAENYALAGLWRDRLSVLDETVIDQKVVLSEALDIDLITLVLEKQEDGLVLGSVFYQSIRDGKVNNVLNYLLSGAEPLDLETSSESDQNEGFGTEIEFLSRFFLSFYYKMLDLPESLYLQVFWRDKISGTTQAYNPHDAEKDVLQALIPEGVKLKLV
jgi:excinuclease ABC subunit C